MNGILSTGVAVALEAGFQYALRAVLEAVLGEPVESRKEALCGPAEVDG